MGLRVVSHNTGLQRRGAQNPIIKDKKPKMLSLRKSTKAMIEPTMLAEAKCEVLTPAYYNPPKHLDGNNSPSPT